MSKPPSLKTQTRSLWNYVKYLPTPLRARLLRSKFEICYQLPSALTLKKAETPDEMNQASVLLQHETAPHVTLIAKWHDEVVGALSLVFDETKQLPSEKFGSLETFRAQNLKIGEISSLSIKKRFRLRRQKLIFPLCKLMYHYCTEILKLDLVITKVPAGAINFYTDVLLFKKLHSRNLTCYFEFNNQSIENYKNIYNEKEKSKNLYHFFIEHQERNDSSNRITYKTAAVAFVNGSRQAEKCTIINVSDTGLKLQMLQPHRLMSIGHEVLIAFERDQEFVICQAQLKWHESDSMWGCEVSEKSYSWEKFTAGLSASAAVQIALKKAA